ncbi:hypothetical protein vseg_014989 [Gypsophila vaccaria]
MEETPIQAEVKICVHPLKEMPNKDGEIPVTNQDPVANQDPAAPRKRREKKPVDADCSPSGLYKLIRQLTEGQKMSVRKPSKE